VVWPWPRNRGHRRGSAPRVAPASPEGPLTDPAFVAGLRPIPSTPPGAGAPWPAADIVGVSPAGASVGALMGGSDGLVLLAFLATRCEGCEEFWRGLRDGADVDLPGSVTVVAVTRGPGTISPADLDEVATGIDGAVIMSDAAWTDYRVSGYPFFVLVEVRSRRVVGETVGFGWPDVASMVRAAIAADEA
jgi:hypothetical protein